MRSLGVLFLMLIWPMMLFGSRLVLGRWGYLQGHHPEEGQVANAEKSIPTYEQVSGKPKIYVLMEYLPMPNQPRQHNQHNRVRYYAEEWQMRGHDQDEVSIHLTLL